tara:strand:- start:158 stop:397 length:240 start_codon:yes stop_codon:yes gene_type:complete
VSIYDTTTATRLALATARFARRDAGTVRRPFDPTLPENEVPKCAAFFDHSADCDLPTSHLCGPSELALALGAMMREVTR